MEAVYECDFEGFCPYANLHSQTCAECAPLKLDVEGYPENCK